MVEGLNTLERLSKARIKIQSKNSFFAYLSLFLKFKESKDLPDYAGMGVDVRGNLYFKKEFVDKLKDEEIQGVLIHEICHIFLLHLQRQGSREHKLFNVASDIVSNNILVENNFELPEGCLKPYNNKITICGKELDVEKKTAEDIYAELENLREEQEKQQGKGQGKGQNEDSEDFDSEMKKVFDEHIKDKNISEDEKRELEKEWINRTHEALSIAKMKGDIPSGVERLVGELHKEKISWRALLYQYITQTIPYNFSFSKPHKKSISVGTYMPYVEKDGIDICLVVDTSGSIRQKEYDDFISEIVGIARAYQERVTMKLIDCDCEVKQMLEVRNGSIEKCKNLKMKGCGGTSFQVAFDWINKNLKDVKLVIYLTDGEGDKVEKQRYPILWVLSKNGRDGLIKDSGRVLKLE